MLKPQNYPPVCFSAPLWAHHSTTSEESPSQILLSHPSVLSSVRAPEL